MKISIAGLVLFVAFVIAGCGGGGSSDGASGGSSNPDPITHQVTSSAGASGSISPESRSVTHGATTTFSVTADSGYRVDSMTGCGGSLSGNTYTTGPITGACTVSARFYLLPVAPQNLQATAGDGEVLLQWTEVDGVDGYALYYATTGEIQPANFGTWVSQHDGVMIENVASPDIVKGLSNGIGYFFVVTATAGGQESGPSNEVSAVPQEPPVVTGGLNDSGIDWCADGSNNNLTCPVAGYPGQDGEFGRDAAALAGTLQKVGAGAAGFDYTKISNSGAELPASATLGNGPNDWACTRDNVTGLIWEVKVDNIAHLRHQDHTYTWYDPNSPDGNPGVQNGGTCTGSTCDTTGFKQAVQTEGLCGASDWRMPTPRELEGIVDYGRHSPAIDPGHFPNTPYFPNTPSSYFWSGSPYAYGSNSAWFVDFYYGRATHYYRSGSFLRVRLVRGGQ